MKRTLIEARWNNFLVLRTVKVRSRRHLRDNSPPTVHDWHVAQKLIHWRNRSYFRTSWITLVVPLAGAVVCRRRDRRTIITSREQSNVKNTHGKLLYYFLVSVLEIALHWRLRVPTRYNNATSESQHRNLEFTHTSSCLEFTYTALRNIHTHLHQNFLSHVPSYHFATRRGGGGGGRSAPFDCIFKCPLSRRI